MEKIEHNILQSASKSLKRFMNISYCNKRIINIAEYIELCKLSNEDIDNKYLKIYGNKSEVSIKKKITDISKFYVNVIHLYASISITTNKIKELYENLIRELDLDIKGLDELYYTGYNIKDNIFDKIVELKDEFDFNLKIFYKQLTGNILPKNIQTFRDINFKILESELKQNNNNNNNPKKGLSKKNNYLNYGNKITNTVNIILITQRELQKMENEIFINDEMKLNPNLNSEKLAQMVVNARKEIIHFYIEYETEYAEVLKIYQQIIEEQLKYVLEKQIEVMENILEDIVFIENEDIHR